MKHWIQTKVTGKSGDVRRRVDRAVPVTGAPSSLECGVFTGVWSLPFAEAGGAWHTGLLAGGASVRPRAALWLPLRRPGFGAAAFLQSKSLRVVSKERAWKGGTQAFSREVAAVSSEPWPTAFRTRGLRGADGAPAAPRPAELGWAPPPASGEGPEAALTRPPLRPLPCVGYPTPPPAVGDALGNPSNSDRPGAWQGPRGGQFSCSVLLLVRSTPAAPSWDPSPQMVPRPLSGLCVAIGPQGPRGGRTERPARRPGALCREGSVRGLAAAGGRPLLGGLCVLTSGLAPAALGTAVMPNPSAATATHGGGGRTLLPACVLRLGQGSLCLAERLPGLCQHSRGPARALQEGLGRPCLLKTGTSANEEPLRDRGPVLGRAHHSRPRVSLRCRGGREGAHGSQPPAHRTWPGAGPGGQEGAHGSQPPAHRTWLGAGPRAVVLSLPSSPFSCVSL